MRENLWISYLYFFMLGATQSIPLVGQKILSLILSLSPHCYIVTLLWNMITLIKHTIMIITNFHLHISFVSCSADSRILVDHRSRNIVHINIYYLCKSHPRLTVLCFYHLLYLLTVKWIEMPWINIYTLQLDKKKVNRRRWVVYYGILNLSRLCANCLW